MPEGSCPCGRTTAIAADTGETGCSSGSPVSWCRRPIMGLASLKYKTLDFCHTTPTGSAGICRLQSTHSAPCRRSGTAPPTSSPRQGPITFFQLSVPDQQLPLRACGGRPLRATHLTSRPHQLRLSWSKSPCGLGSPSGASQLLGPPRTVLVTCIMRAARGGPATHLSSLSRRGLKSVKSRTRHNRTLMTLRRLPRGHTSQASQEHTRPIPHSARTVAARDRACDVTAAAAAN